MNNSQHSVSLYIYKIYIQISNCLAKRNDYIIYIGSSSKWHCLWFRLNNHILLCSALNLFHCFLFFCFVFWIYPFWGLLSVGYASSSVRNPKTNSLSSFIRIHSHSSTVDNSTCAETNLQTLIESNRIQKW